MEYICNIGGENINNCDNVESHRTLFLNFILTLIYLDDVSLDYQS